MICFVFTIIAINIMINCDNDIYSTPYASFLNVNAIVAPYVTKPKNESKRLKESSHEREREREGKRDGPATKFSPDCCNEGPAFHGEEHNCDADGKGIPMPRY